MDGIFKKIWDFITWIFAIIFAISFVILFIGIVFAIVYYIGYGIGFVVEYLTGNHKLFGISMKQAFGYIFMFIALVYTLIDSKNKNY